MKRCDTIIKNIRKDAFSNRGDAVKNMKKKDFVAKVAQANGLSNAKTAEVIDSFIEELVNALADGEKILLSGFGTIEVKDRAGRIGRHPVTGEQIQLPDTKVVSFRQSSKLREKINNK